MTVDRRAAMLTAATILGFVVFVVLAIAVANLIPGTGTVVKSRGYIHVNIYLATALALVFGLTLCVFVYIGVADRRAGRKISTLYLPLIAEPLCLFVIFGLAAIAGLDREHHNLSIPLVARWNQTPAVQVLQIALFYTALLTAYGWLNWIVLRGRGWSRRQVLALDGGLLAVALALVLAAALT